MKERLDEARLSEMFDAADRARGDKAHLSNEVFDLISALETAYAELAEKDAAIKELHDRASHYAAVRDNAVDYGYKQAQEIHKLRKALEDIRNSTGIGYEAAWRYAVELAENALK